MPSTNRMVAFPVPLLVGSFCLRMKGLELHGLRSLRLHLVFSELVYKTPSLKAFREEPPHLWVPMEDSVKCISLEMLFWAGVEAENLNVSQGEATEYRYMSVGLLWLWTSVPEYS